MRCGVGVTPAITNKNQARIIARGGQEGRPRRGCVRRETRTTTVKRNRKRTRQLKDKRHKVLGPETGADAAWRDARGSRNNPNHWEREGRLNYQVIGEKGVDGRRRAEKIPHVEKKKRGRG